MRSRFFACTAGVAAAALTGVFFGISAKFIPLLLFLALFSAVLLTFSSVRAKNPGLSQGLLIALGFFAMGLYFSAYTLVFSRMAAPYSGFSGQLELQAVDFPSDDGELTVRIISDGRPSPYKLRLSSYVDLPEISPGSHLTAEVKLHSPENTPRFSGQRHFRAENIYLTGYITQISDHSPGQLSLLNWPRHLRHAALSRCDLLYGEKAYMLKGLLFGDRSDFSDGFTASASASGVFHIFSVSGMHLSFCVAAVLYLSRRKWAYWVAGAIVLLFMSITGFEPTVVRAGVMQLAAICAHIIGRDRSSSRAFAGSLLLLLLINPWAIGDIGLQLSFCSVAGMLLTGEHVSRWLLKPIDRLPQRLKKPYTAISEATAVSISASVLTTPLTVLYFSRVSLVAAISNLATNWIVSVVFIAGIASLLLSAIWDMLGAMVAFLNSAGVTVLEFMIQIFARLPGAILGTESILVKLAIALTYIAGGVFGLKQISRPVLKTAIFGVATVSLGLIASFFLNNRTLRLILPDAGAGECTLISAQGSNIAVDCHGTALLTELENRNIFHLDLLILTCPESLDLTCADELISRGRVRRLVLSPGGNRESAEKLLSLADSLGIPAEKITSDRLYSFGDLRLLVSVPPADGDTRGNAAVFLQYDGASVFIPGRTSPKAQEYLLETRKYPIFQALVLSRGGRESSLSDKILTHAKDGAVLVCGSSPRQAPALNTREIFQTHLLGDLELVFFREKTYLINQ